jgi:hypothetical protein
MDKVESFYRECCGGCIKTNHLNVVHCRYLNQCCTPSSFQVLFPSCRYVNWTGANKFADVERRIRRVWAEDSANTSLTSLSKILIFCNRSAKVIEMGEYLSEKGIKNVAMTSQSEHRGRGSNKHLAGFLRKDDVDVDHHHQDTDTDTDTKSSTNVKDSAHVMITTSLLSRGLDFSPSIKHVFIVDEPRNMIDFLHRAGRSGRAGQNGKVVMFGKMTGRGNSKTCRCEEACWCACPLKRAFHSSPSALSVYIFPNKWVGKIYYILCEIIDRMGGKNI